MPKTESALTSAAWRVPDWPAPPNVRALCTTRAAGVSVGAGYAGLNLGDHVNDLPAHVASNRQILRSAIDATPRYLRQVHGIDVCQLQRDSVDGQQADASFTEAVGIACTVMVADCLPVLICDAAGTRVGAAHCGWRSLSGGVLERVLDGMAAPSLTGSPAQSPHDWMAWLGPCIGPQAFEVGDDVKQAFEARDAAASQCFKPGAVAGKWLADLPRLARQRLQSLGVKQVFGNDGTRPWCTVSNPSEFFSFRRDGAASGRFAALIWRS